MQFHRGNQRVLVTISIAAVLGFQEPAPVTLKPSTATLNEEFTFASSVRELRDGRVIITDSRESRIIVADLRTGGIAPIGRTGAGPGEYTWVSPVFALGGDSTLMADSDGRRWFVLDGARIVATLPPDSRPIVATGGETVRGADRFGNVIVNVTPRPPSGVSSTTYKDSVWIVRVSLATGRVDTIARARAVSYTKEVGRDAAGHITSMRNIAFPPYALEEPAVLCSDGWLAVVRLDPYRVDWRSPTGAWTRGQTLIFQKIAVTAREKRAYMERLAKSAGRPAASPDMYSPWPTVVPPVEPQAPRAAMCTLDGRVLVNRTKTADQPGTRYDLVDHRGVRVMQLALAASERIVGFGSHSVYVVTTDDDGLQRLRRHPWP